jgi:hypothetical protein
VLPSTAVESKARANVRTTANVEPLTSTTSPRFAGEMKRVTRMRAESCETATPRTGKPRLRVPLTARVVGSSRRSCREPSVVTYAAAPFGAKARPNGIEACGSAIVCTIAPVSPFSTLIVALPWFTTQRVPSGARAALRGFVPTTCSRAFVSVAVLIAVTVSASGFTTHMRLRAESSASVPEWFGRPAGSG